jgi:hypothetical protein
VKWLHLVLLVFSLLALKGSKSEILPDYEAGTTWGVNLELQTKTLNASCVTDAFLHIPSYQVRGTFTPRSSSG